MVEIIAFIVIGLAVLLIVLAGFSVFISYVTQSTYTDLPDYGHCGSCRTYNCLACKCDSEECCK
jgi:hypothetical protein